MEWVEIVESEEGMLSFGERLAKLLKKGDVVFLYGPLGAGKTTLVRGIARGMGYQGRVTSPTFTLLNIYPGEIPIYHYDFYRLGKELTDEEGWSEKIYGEGLTLVEWPPRGFPEFPSVTVEIELGQEVYTGPRLVRVRFWEEEVVE